MRSLSSSEVANETESLENLWGQDSITSILTASTDAENPVDTFWEEGLRVTGPADHQHPNHYDNNHRDSRHHHHHQAPAINQLRSSVSSFEPLEAERPAAALAAARRVRRTMSEPPKRLQEASAALLRIPRRDTLVTDEEIWQAIGATHLFTFQP